MPQLFHPSSNTIAKASIVGILLILGGALGLVGAYFRSSYVTRMDTALLQPVLFSHEHHFKGLGIDCRYCHTSVETSSFAGMPPTETCMTCHSQIWRDSPMLQPVRTSLQTRIPIAWNRVYDLPDFVYFDHSIHVQKGIGCTTCHGQVDRMPLMRKKTTLLMQWCLDCHRQPERFIRPREEVFNMDWQPPQDQIARGQRLVQAYRIRTDRLMDCYICHR